MKNKKLMYVLLPAVLCIWGIIFYRIFSKMNPSVEPSNVFDHRESISETKMAVDSFSLHSYPRDPFLAKNASPKEIVEKPEKSISVQPIIQPTLIQWPQVSYQGTISNKKSSKQLALLTINNQERIIKSGDIIEGISIEKVYPDSILLRFQREKKTFKK